MARFDLQKLYIDGGYSDAGSDATFEAINPANGEVLAQVQRATFDDVERAVVSAEKGQKNLGRHDRPWSVSRILRRAVDILRERNDELAALETLDTGKAFSETKYVDIVTGADVLEYYAGLVTCHRRRADPTARHFVCLHPPRAAGRGRRYRRVELPDPDRPVEIRTGPGRR